jgi:hypothetical protein
MFSKFAFVRYALMSMIEFYEIVITNPCAFVILVNIQRLVTSKANELMSENNFLSERA